jgi:hypothetical protein
MKVQLGKNLKIFLTTNLSPQGKVLDTGFNSNNTEEIFVVSNSISASQTKDYEYVDNYNLLTSEVTLESLAKANLSVGSLNFSTTFNSSAQGPFDITLWNALSNQANYPAGIWQIAPTSQTMSLVRTANVTNAVGVIIFTDNLAYVFDAVRVNSLSMSFQLDSVLVNNWECSFDTFRVLQGALISYIYSQNIYQLTGELTGSILKNSAENYNWAGGKMLKVSVGKQFNSYSTSLASLGLNISIKNNQTYITDNSIDRQKLSQNYVEAGSFTAEGDITVYTRGPGSDSYELIRELSLYRDDPYYTGTHNILLEVMSTASTKICEIQLKSCVLQTSTEFSNTLTDRIDFKVVQGEEAQDCFIKFYT